MLKDYTLKNFQSHENSKLEFSPGLNAIIGLSDKGKSVLLRGLVWLVLNEAPEDFIRWGTGTKGKRGAEISGTASSEVTIERDGKSLPVRRTKGHEINCYACGEEDFNTIGKAVPEEVARVLNLSDINIQTQFARHYLLFETGGTIASTFNKLTNLDKVDDIVTLLNSDLNKMNQRKVYAQEELEKKEEQLKKFGYLAELEENVIICEDIDKEFAEHTASRCSLTRLVNSFKEHTDSIANADTQLVALSELLNSMKISKGKLEVIEVDLGNLDKEAASLHNIIADLLDAQDRLKDIGGSLPVLSKQMDLLKNQASLESAIEKVHSFRDKLKTLITNSNDNDENKQTTEDNIAASHKSLAELTKQFEEVDTCALCEQPLTKAAKKTMLENL